MQNPYKLEVMCRVRPLSDHQKSTIKVIHNQEICVMKNEFQTQKFGPFGFILDENYTQYDVYQTFAKPKVDQFMNGVSGTLICYGQSGSGKSHTMFGSPTEPGVFQMALQTITSQEKSVSLSAVSVLDDKVTHLLENDSVLTADV